MPTYSSEFVNQVGGSGGTPLDAQHLDTAVIAQSYLVTNPALAYPPVSASLSLSQPTITFVITAAGVSGQYTATATLIACGAGSVAQDNYIDVLPAGTFTVSTVAAGVAAPALANAGNALRLYYARTNSGNTAVASINPLATGLQLAPAQIEADLAEAVSLDTLGSATSSLVNTLNRVRYALQVLSGLTGNNFISSKAALLADGTNAAPTLAFNNVTTTGTLLASLGVNLGAGSAYGTNIHGDGTSVYLEANTGNVYLRSTAGSNTNGAYLDTAGNFNLVTGGVISAGTITSTNPGLNSFAGSMTIANQAFQFSSGGGYTNNLLTPYISGGAGVSFTAGASGGILAAGNYYYAVTIVSNSSAQFTQTGAQAHYGESLPSAIIGPIAVAANGVVNISLPLQYNSTDYYYIYRGVTNSFSTGVWNRYQAFPNSDGSISTFIDLGASLTGSAMALIPTALTLGIVPPTAASFPPQQAVLNSGLLLSKFSTIGFGNNYSGAAIASEGPVSAKNEWDLTFYLPSNTGALSGYYRNYNGQFRFKQRDTGLSVATIDVTTGNFSTLGQISTGSGNGVLDGGGNLSLRGNIFLTDTAVPQSIVFSPNSGGAALPTSTNTSGQKIVLWQQSPTDATQNYALGIAANTLWYNSDGAGSMHQFMASGASLATISSTGLNISAGIALNSGNLVLSNPVQNTIDFGTAGVQLPTAGSLGEKLILYNGGSAAGSYALGVASGTLWYNTASGASHQFMLGGTTQVTINNALSTATGIPILSGGNIYFNIANTSAITATTPGIGNNGSSTIIGGGLGGVRIYPQGLGTILNSSVFATNGVLYVGGAGTGTGNVFSALFSTPSGLTQISDTGIDSNGPVQIVAAPQASSRTQASLTAQELRFQQITGDDTQAGSITYRTLSGTNGLDIVGAGVAGSRFTRIWDNLALPNGALTVQGVGTSSFTGPLSPTGGLTGLAPKATVLTTGAISVSSAPWGYTSATGSYTTNIPGSVIHGFLYVQGPSTTFVSISVKIDGVDVFLFDPYAQPNNSIYPFEFSTTTAGSHSVVIGTSGAGTYSFANMAVTLREGF